MKLALALSGGGYRATVFHLGVLARLAESNQLEDVNFLSTVSGGSLCAGMVFALNGFRWPSSQEYLHKVSQAACYLLTTQDLQRQIIIRTLRRPWTIFETRADDLSALMSEYWGVNINLRDLPDQPRWLINATCYESGKSWRFEKFRMGDYWFGYSYDTDVPLSDAMAASAGFPGGIGPLVLDTSRYKWFKYNDSQGEPRAAASPEGQRRRITHDIEPPYSPIHLWDGGAYDNLGLEGLIDVQHGWRDQVEFLLVSDASGRSGPARYQRGINALLRLTTGILMDQVRSLHSRIVIERLVNHGDQDKGGFLQIGNTCTHVLAAAGREAEVTSLATGCLSDAEAHLAESMPTVIRRLTSGEYERLFRHGFEVADYTLYAYHPDQFPFIGYANRTHE